MQRYIVNSELEPKLAPPGAGLPKIELLIARGMFAWQRRIGNRESFGARFQHERAVIRGLVRTCDAETGAQRVLIRRVRGLEDSSRYWSVWMTLDHLRIVHGQMARVIRMLIAGREPKGKASTANVKPSPTTTVTVVPKFEESCDTLLATVAEAAELQTPLRYAHPWFGPLDAAGWHALAPGHLAIHRVQIERILRGLQSSGVKARPQNSASRPWAPVRG